MQLLKILIAISLSLSISIGVQAQTKILKHIDDPDEYDRIDDMTVVDSLMFFTANNGDDEGELYVTDGTPEGTIVLTNIAPPGNLPYIEELTAFNGKLLFQATTEELGSELYISDGTSGGTRLLKDINEGDYYGEPGFFGILDNRAFFSAELGSFPRNTVGTELWVTDGTTAGTHLFKDLAPGYSYSSTFMDTITHDSQPYNFQTINGKLYFSARTPNEAREPWVSDGTAEGTHLIKDINITESETGIPYDSDPYLYEINGKAVFAAKTTDSRLRKLFATDGTEEGTKLIEDFSNEGDDGSQFGIDSKPVEYNGAWYFLHNAQVWKSDATAEGTEMIIDLAAEEYIIEDGGDIGNKLIPFRDELYFFDNYNLWKTDGTASGTVKAVSSKFQRVVEYYNWEVIQLNDRLYFVASDDAYGLAGEVGKELWMSDGTPEGTTWVADLRTGTERGGPVGSDPEHLRLLGNKILFVADGNEYQNKLWISSGFPERNAIIEDTVRTIHFEDIGLQLNFPEIELESTFALDALYNFKANFENDSLADSLEIISQQLWTITPDTAATFNAEVCLDLNRFAESYSEDDELVVIKRDSVGRDWELLETQISTDGTFICAAPVSSFSDFTIAKIVDTGEEDSTDVSNELLERPHHFALQPAYPNPFNPSTTIGYSIPKASEVRLTIFNITGQKVATLVNKQQQAGNHNVTLNADRLSSGIYFYRLDAGGKTQVQKMTLVK